jgi:predicted RNA-binding protein with RPS1 domain
MNKMVVMNLQADLKWIHQELENVKDPTFIKAIKNMLKYRKKVSTDRISIEQYNEEINISIAQIESGQTYTHQEMGERIKQWTKQ